MSDRFCRQESHYMDHSILYALVCENIRTQQKCVGGIEISVPRMTDWNHEACRVISHVYNNGNPDLVCENYFHLAKNSVNPDLVCEKIVSEFIFSG